MVSVLCCRRANPLPVRTTDRTKCTCRVPGSRKVAAVIWSFRLPLMERLMLCSRPPPLGAAAGSAGGVGSAGGAGGAASRTACLSAGILTSMIKIKKFESDMNALATE
eukprot:scaffold29840_cov59-Phaeocystis_antarctica.AAC.2